MRLDSLKFCTAYDCDTDVVVEISDEQLTEQTGYASNSELIDLVIRSGEALEDYRHAVFDMSHDDEMESVPVYEIDPTVLRERMDRRAANREAKRQAALELATTGAKPPEMAPKADLAKDAAKDAPAAAKDAPAAEK